jgi:hypothetical protein
MSPSRLITAGAQEDTGEIAGFRADLNVCEHKAFNQRLLQAKKHKYIGN